jgi:murein DD-endopeptidase MepM/ murein hydrolase activator NlpD
MFRKNRYFRFSDSTLDFREVRYVRTKLLGTGVVLGLLGSAIVLLVNTFLGDPFGLGAEKAAAIVTENRVLKSRISELTERFEVVQEVMGRIAERGNELRMVADLRPLDADTRQAAVGGSAPMEMGAFLSGEAAAILGNAQELIDKLGREVQLQRQSYEAIARQMESNRDFFTHLPALKPMEGPYSVHGFGMRVHPVLRVYRMHPGVDIAGDVGTPIYAAADGVVRYAGRTEGGYGIVVDISHGYGYSTLYGHCSSVLVRPGRTVKRGEIIALAGRTGLVSGPHLHYEVRRNGMKLNPVDYFFDDVDAAKYRTMLASASEQ